MTGELATELFADRSFVDMSALAHLVGSKIHACEDRGPHKLLTRQPGIDLNRFLTPLSFAYGSCIVMY